MRRTMPAGRVLLLLMLLLTMAPASVRADGPLALSDYPRPVKDNGRGIHWAPTLFAQPKDMVDRFVAEADAMGLRWVKLVQGDAPKLEHSYLIACLKSRGMMPVLRVYKPGNEPYENLTALVRLGVPAGVYYYELYNEPNLSGRSGGWAPGEDISVSRIVDLWLPAADAVTQAGGYPGLPSLAPGGDYPDTAFLRNFLLELKARGRLDALYHAWLPIHNYFLNHPLNYPYDNVNLHSTPLTQADIARWHLTAADMASINQARADSHLPRSQGGYYVGDTVDQDSNGFLKFEAYANILRDQVGFVIPMITTEGGAIVGTHEDPRYPPVSEDDLTDMTLAAMRYMTTQAPPYYFAFMPWLMANRAGNSLELAWESAAWYKEDGTARPVVTALKQLAQADASAPVSASQAVSLATAIPSPAPGRSALLAQAQPSEAPRLAQAALRVTSFRRSFRFPEVGAATRPSTPADPTYPLPALANPAGVSSLSRECDVLSVANDRWELWLLPELGARIVRVLDQQSGRELLPAVDQFALKPLANGAYEIEGGVAWAYPSAALPLAAALPWKVEDVQGSVRLTCHEPRSGSDISLQISGDNESLSVQFQANNPNSQPRRLALAISGPSGIVSLANASEALVAPGGSQTWTLRLADASSAGQSSATAPAPRGTPQPAQRAATPIALVTPVPAPDSPRPPSVATPIAPQSPTTAAPTVTAPAQSNNLDWDARLTQLGIAVAAKPGARWRLVQAIYEDETQAGGNHHIFVRLLDASGRPCQTTDELPWVSWPDGRQVLDFKQTQDGYQSDFPMYGMLGNYAVGVGASSDTISGLGLPGKHHVNYRLTFQRQP